MYYINIMLFSKCFEIEFKLEILRYTGPRGEQTPWGTRGVIRGAGIRPVSYEMRIFYFPIYLK